LTICAEEKLVEFNEFLLQSIDETMTALLSPEVANALYLHLRKTHLIQKEQVPYNLETLCHTFEQIFGYASSRTICKAIAKRLYVKLGLPFTNAPTKTLIEFVEEAKGKLEKSEGQL
jgi:hypothetical protein